MNSSNRGLFWHGENCDKTAGKKNEKNARKKEERETNLQNVVKLLRQRGEGDKASESGSTGAWKR